MSAEHADNDAPSWVSRFTGLLSRKPRTKRDLEEVLSIAADDEVIDASGKYLIPGLADMHVHMSYFGASAAPLLVANGVTLVRDMGGEPAFPAQTSRNNIAAHYCSPPGDPTDMRNCVPSRNT